MQRDLQNPLICLFLYVRRFDAQVFLNCHSYLFPKAVGKRRDGAAALVTRDAFHSVHGIENQSQADGGLFLGDDLAKEIVKRAEIHAPQSHARSVKREELSPNLFLGRRQADNHNGINFHRISRVPNPTWRMYGPVFYSGNARPANQMSKSPSSSLSG